MHSGLISLLGNGLAVHVFGKKGRDIAVSEVFLLNIAVVDQFQVCASYLAAIISAFCHRWIFDDIGTVCLVVCIYIRWIIQRRLKLNAVLFIISSPTGISRLVNHSGLFYLIKNRYISY